MSIFFSTNHDNGIIELLNGVISLREPRDSYDKDGYFTSPEKKIIKKFKNSQEYHNDALSESIKYFLSFANSDLKIPLIKVKDSRKALSIISSNFYKYPSKRINTIGITGTNGKTTIAFLITQCLN